MENRFNDESPYTCSKVKTLDTTKEFIGRKNLFISSPQKFNGINILSTGISFNKSKRPKDKPKRPLLKSLENCASSSETLKEASSTLVLNGFNSCEPFQLSEEKISRMLKINTKTMSNSEVERRKNMYQNLFSSNYDNGRSTKVVRRYLQKSKSEYPQMKPKQPQDTYYTDKRSMNSSQIYKSARSAIADVKLKNSRNLHISFENYENRNNACYLQRKMSNHSEHSALNISGPVKSLPSMWDRKYDAKKDRIKLLRKKKIKKRISLDKEDGRYLNTSLPLLSSSKPKKRDMETFVCGFLKNFGKPKYKKMKLSKPTNPKKKGYLAQINSGILKRYKISQKSHKIP
ncbi:unnamed protein product [Moneuplotes crassus]|uniref:Uncharacterized protein n=1 Tax=Euplotes crassus TaxID=5936 RepID=A0AAD1UIQ4_EUPCR|nr:unnamed protein product [Moneuplotes crassus]